MPGSGANPSVVFDRFGLKSGGYGFSGTASARKTEFEPGEGLAHALAELGGVYAAFARFLMWRSDLLREEYIEALRNFTTAPAPVSPDRLVAILQLELPGASSQLLADLEAEPLWNTFSRIAWKSKYRGFPVIVQIACPPVLESELEAFERSIRFLRHPDFSKVTSPPVLNEFREWLRQCESLETERAYLEVLGSGETLAEFPRLIEEISTSRVLCWPFIEGESAASLIRRGSVDTVTKLATGILEELFSFGIVDAELDPEAIVLSGEHLTVRRINHAVSVPPALVNSAMKYIAAVLVGDNALTAETLVTLAAGLSSRTVESKLLNLMSGLDPELKVHVWYPASAAAFESNWRALARMDLSRPLFLDCLHRNLIAIGYWNAVAVAGRGRYIDAIEEGHWPAVERIFRAQLAKFRDPNVVTEWLAGSSLLMAGSMRQMNRLMEEIRDSNVPAPSDDPGSTRNPEQLNRAVRLGTAAAGLLVVFLACLRWGATAPRPLEILLKILAPFALAGLFWMVAKIG